MLEQIKTNIYNIVWTCMLIRNYDFFQIFGKIAILIGRGPAFGPKYGLRKFLRSNVVCYKH